MAIQRFSADVTAEEIRGMTPDPPTDTVAEILAQVRDGGDAAIAEIEARLGGGDGPPVRVAPEVIAAAPDQLDIDLLQALKLSIANVRQLAEASRGPAEALERLPQGQTVNYRALPVGRAAAYVPGGRGSYPSTAVMCLTTAKAAGVESICVVSPPRENGQVDETVLAVCALLGVTEVYPIGGAQAVAAVAFGTETITAVDVVVGPGNSYVQEAKRQLTGRIGIDSVAGPSELVVLADATADPELIALDLMAQGEHGPDSLVALISTDLALLEEVERRCDSIGAALALVQTTDLGAGARLLDEIAPEHAQLMVSKSFEEQLATSIECAGALFVGRNAATAFGDYVIGSNHVLPTGGAARFASALSVSTFTRRMAEIRVADAAAGKLADAGAQIARAEGFTWHAKSMEAREQ